MEVSYQMILAVGELDDIRAVVGDAVITPVGERRWAVVPALEEGAYAESLAERLGMAAFFSVVDSEVLVAMVFRDGRAVHEYLSDQAFLLEAEDDDGNEILYDLLGRPYLLDATPPSGPFGADAAAFVELGVPPVDEAALGAALGRRTGGNAVERHRAILDALNVDPRVVPLGHGQAEHASADDRRAEGA